jgi:hypothetical protein
MANFIRGAAFVIMAGGTALAQVQVCFPDRNGDGHPMFSPTAAVTRTVGTPSNGQVVAAAMVDLDGDGDLDAAACSCPSNPFDPPGRIVILMNDGDGIFGPPIDIYDAGHCPVHVEGADFDGDGDQDLIVADRCSDAAVLLINKGDATFGPGVPYLVGDEPRSLGVADVNADGRPDVVTFNQTSKDLSVLLSKPSGGFAPEQRTTTLSLTKNNEFPYPGPFMTLADVDGDGDIDVAAPGAGGVLLVLNDGAGTLTAGPKLPTTGTSAFAVAANDFDGDGDIDIASTTLDKDFVSVHLNLGGGIFAPATTYNVTWPFGSPGAKEVCSITSGDFDGDGHTDLAAGSAVDTEVRLLMGRGDGTFEPVRFRSVSEDAWFVIAADANGDGLDDLAVQTRLFYPAVFLALLSLPGEPAISFETNTPYSIKVPMSPEDVQLADMNGDGDPDAVVASGGKGGVAIINAVEGVFVGEGVKYPVHPDATQSHLERVHVADFNGDGWPDVAASDIVNVSEINIPGLVVIYLNKGDGTLAAPQHYPLTGLTPDTLASADVDGDGDLDLAVWTCELHPGGNGTEPVARKVLMFMNDGTGAFSLSAEYLTDLRPYSSAGDVAFADLDGDGDPDMLSTAFDADWQVYTQSLLRVRFNDGGTFGETYALDTAQRLWGLDTVDADDDGDLDVFTLHRVNVDLPPPVVYLSLYVNDGQGGLTLDRQYTASDDLGFKHLQVVRQEPSGPLRLFFFGSHRLVVQTFDYDAPEEPPLAFYNVGFSRSGLAVRERASPNGPRVDVVVSSASPNQLQTLLDRSCPSASCPADCDANAKLNIDDFICFMTNYSLIGDPSADCDARRPTHHRRLHLFPDLVRAGVLGGKAQSARKAQRRHGLSG